MCEECQQLKKTRDAALEEMRRAIAKYAGTAQDTAGHRSEFSTAVERARDAAYAVNQHWLGIHGDRPKTARVAES